MTASAARSAPRAIAKATLAAASLLLLSPTPALAAPSNAAPLFPERWIDGTLPAEPVTQVQRLDAGASVARQRGGGIG